MCEVFRRLKITAEDELVYLLPHKWSHNLLSHEVNI